VRALVLAAASLAPGMAAALELELDVGRYASGSDAAYGRAEGTALRAGVSASRRPGERVQWSGEWRRGEAAVGARAGWAGLSMRYLRGLDGARATGWAGVGFDLGSALRGRGPSLEASTPALSGHVFLGVNVPLSPAWNGVASVVVGVDGAGVPWATVAAGGAWAL
jgi:hypothetical protein